MVRATRQVVRETADPHNVERVDPWRAMSEIDWIVNCNGWRRVSDRTQLCVEDEQLPRTPKSMIGCIWSFVGGSLLSPAFPLLWRVVPAIWRAVVEFTSRAIAISRTVVFMMDNLDRLWRWLLQVHFVVEFWAFQLEQLQSLKRCSSGGRFRSQIPL